MSTTQNTDKTLRQLLSELPEPYASLAIRRSQIDELDQPGYGKTSATALACAFIFSDTPEGWDFWDRVRDAAQHHTQFPEVP